MGFLFAIQMLMVMNNHIFNLAKHSPSVNSNDGKEEDCEGKGNNSRLVLKSITSFIMTHMTLGHSAFLFIVSLFAVLNRLQFALWFLVVHATLTLSLMVVINFYRLRNGRQHHYN